MISLHIKSIVVSSVMVSLFLFTVGSPISVSKIECPTQEDIDKLHERYIDELKGLYEKYKDKYHPSERSELSIV